MQAFVLFSILLSTPTDQTSVETFAAAGEAHLRAATPGEHQRGEWEGAHRSFDSAFLLSDDARYLCRALAVTELALQTGIFGDEQERLSWAELRDEDRSRLREAAAATGRPNCRYDGSGRLQPPRVALLDPDAPSPSPAPAPPPPGPVRAGRAPAISGALLTATGLGLLGALAGVLALENQRLVEMRDMVRVAEDEGRRFTLDEDRHFGDLKADLLRGRGVAIGVGVAGLASFTSGVALLVRKKKNASAHALQPYGGPQGLGALLRLKF